jgi:crotonobetainyl-CoA:carnitine CoA-transferase CaiB-like acyl-CoA transferase
MTALRGGAACTRSNPVVVDLSSLWAGPLCANLLGLTGARVIKVESAHRLDGARHGPTVFFDLLHADHESVVLDLTMESDRHALRALVEAADLVVEASRPRALEQLGVYAANALARGVSWLSITAYGRTPLNAMRVGFGDDVAAAAGLVCWDGPQPLPVGDAIADPLAGAVAAAAAGAALQSSNAWLIDVSMRDVAALSQRVAARHDSVTVSRIDDGWQICRDRDRIPVTAPTARVSTRAAVAPGADTAAVLSELVS